METTGFSPPCSAETSGQATSSGSYNPPLPPAKAPRGAEETKTARSAAAPAIALAHLAEASASHAMVVEQSPSVSSVTIRSSDEELDILAAASVLLKRKELKEFELLEAAAQQRLAALRSARGSRASSGRSGQQLRRALVPGTLCTEKSQLENSSPVRGNLDRRCLLAATFVELASPAEAGAPAQTNNLLIIPKRLSS